MARRFVGDVAAGALQRLQQHARGGTSAASAPAICRRGPACAATRPPSSRLSVSASGCASSPPTSSSRAGIDQPVDQCGRDQAARRVVHQHPVVVGRAGACAARTGRWPRLPRAWHRRRARPGPMVGLRSKKPSPGATTTSVRAMRLHAGEGGQRVPDHGLAGHALVLLGPGRAGAAAVPAQGTECKKACRDRVRCFHSYAIAFHSRIEAAHPTLVTGGVFCILAAAFPSWTYPNSVNRPNAFTLPRPPGSADALLLARLAEREKAGGPPHGHRHGRCQRRAAPDRRDRLLRARICAARCFPTGKRCPTTPSRRTRT